MKETTFWNHLEELRWAIIRSLGVIAVLTIVIFCFKDFVFNSIILAPCKESFVTYRLLCKLADFFHSPGLCPEIGSLNLININLAAQLFVHLSVSFSISLTLAVPYVITEVWLYVAPALYTNEKKPALKGIIAFVVLFFLGILLAYYVIFPLTLNFLGSYQVSEVVPNQISLNSYISSFLSLLFMIGIAFELPVVAYFFASIGILKHSFLKKYRKISIVIVLTLAAMITPSTDIFTMMLVAVPLQLLYELSIITVKNVEKRKGNKE